MVHGFVGDDRDWLAANTCLFLIVNYFFYEVLVEFLRQRLPWFDWMRTDPLKSGIKICLCSMFDILFTVMPIVLVISDYQNGLKYQVYQMSLTALLLLFHYLDGSHQNRPIISSWLLPGGVNSKRGMYDVVTRTETFKSG